MAKAKKLPSGNWRVLLYTGKDETGKRKYESFTAETKDEAEFLAAEYKLKKPKKSSSITLGEAYDRYIESKSAILSPSTIREYKRMRKMCLQGLMDKSLSKLTGEDIQKEFNKEAKTHSPKTLRNMHGLLSAVIKMQRPDFNLTTTLPQKEKHEIYIPDEKTIKRLYNLAKGTNIEIPFLLASQLGMRASEICGLQYSCIDSDKNEITIKQARVRSEDGTVLKKPKSYAGYRTIPCSKHIIDLIGKGNKDDFIINATTTIITNRWRAFLKKNNEEHFNFHALRHYFASQALLLGVPQKYIAELMGHASEHMINTVYQHTFKDAKKQFAIKIAEGTDSIFD